MARIGLDRANVYGADVDDNRFDEAGGGANAAAAPFNFLWLEDGDLAGMREALHADEGRGVDVCTYEVRTFAVRARRQTHPCEHTCSPRAPL